MDTTIYFQREVQGLARPELRPSPNFFPSETYLLRITGRIARNGPFGHSGLYDCQIRPLRMLSAETRR